MPPIPKKDVSHSHDRINFLYQRQGFDRGILTKSQQTAIFRY